jgi:uncharacterized protein (TIGR02466 family)
MEYSKFKLLFSTPIMEFNLASSINPAIIKVLTEMEGSTNNAVHGVRGSQDPSRLPELKSLYAIFQECVNLYCQELGLTPNRIESSWVNILYKGGAVDIHRHHNSIVSGAFYPHVNSNSSSLVFVSPLDGYRMMDSSRFVRNTEYAGNIHVVPTETGKLVLFPSWLQHYVPPNNSDLRITLSFNTQFL